MTVLRSALALPSYLLDFTAQATQNLKTGGNGSKTIDGRAWTWANDAAAQSADIINGAGLILSCNTTNSTGNPATRSAPILSVPFSSLIPDYSVSQHIIRVMVRVLLGNAGADTEGVRVSVEDSSSPTSQAFSVYKGHVGGIDSWFPQTCVSAAATTIGNTTNNFSDDVIGITFEAPKSFDVRTGVLVSGALPSTLPHFLVAEIQDMASPIMRTQGKPALSLSVQSGNTSGDIIGTFTHMRVDVFSKIPN